MAELTAVYIAAGMSSRFGGRIKALIKVGPNNESLMELSMDQAKKAGFDKFVFVVSKKTIEPIKEYFKDSFKGIPIEYCFQETPEYREKPFGTAHALLSAKDFVKEPFIVLNSDDIYGKETMKKIADYMLKNKNACCLPGYELKNVLSEEGGVNRGLITYDKDGFVDNIKEHFDIKRSDLPSKYSGNELMSMNLFGLQPEFFAFLEQDFERFLNEIKGDSKKEYLLPEAISNFKEKSKIKVKVIPTTDQWIGVTYPQDEEKVRNLLKV
jgi:NDP-sugar pyrophosphorylase family protein